MVVTVAMGAGLGPVRRLERAGGKTAKRYQDGRVAEKVSGRNRRKFIKTRDLDASKSVHSVERTILPVLFLDIAVGNFLPFTSTSQLIWPGLETIKSRLLIEAPSESTLRFASSTATYGTPRLRRYSSNAAS